MDHTSQTAAIERRSGHQVLRVEPWGRDTIRVRSALHHLREDIPHALLEPAASDAVVHELAGGAGELVNGSLTARVDEHGVVSFTRTGQREPFLREEPGHFWTTGPRRFTNTRNTYSRIEQHFAAAQDERFFGLGQHPNGHLDHKGLVVDLVQRNAEVSIPFYLSNRGYGFLWNSPATGRVEFGKDVTRWVADEARQIDYVVFLGDGPRDVLARYADATGHPPRFPEWATGFWQSKLRYRTQEELLSVAREYHRRGIPVAVIVADFFHWTRTGEYRFDLREFPDPQAMVDELASMGMRLMVSLWPILSPLSPDHGEAQERGLLVGTEQGVPFVLSDWLDKGFEQRLPVNYYDPTNPATREFVWNRVREHYYRLGIRTWWLDGCEPEIRPQDFSNVRFAAGLGTEVANLYPQAQARTFFDGMAAEDDEDFILFARSAWAGSQRYATAVWSGDIATDFDSLARQVRAGISMALSGIPWWTTDIGGFHGGDPSDPDYRELLVRWFQFGVFCPIFRLHGHREPRGADNGSTEFKDAVGPLGYGGPNEIWSYGEENYPILTAYLAMRERLRPYVQEQMDVASAEGIPPIRALFVEFPDDDVAWSIEDEYLFGPSLLVAPVVEAGARRRSVYLPAGATWTNAWTGETVDGGRRIDVEAPIDRIPLFTRDGARLPILDDGE